MAKKKQDEVAAPAAPTAEAPAPAAPPAPPEKTKRERLHEALDKVLLLEKQRPGSLTLGVARDDFKKLLAGATDPQLFWAAKNRYDAASHAEKASAVEGLHAALDELVERSWK